MKLTRTLKYRMRGDDVKYVQTILQQQGFFQGTPLGNFLSLTLEAVKYFQGTHIGEDKTQLKVDGEVGPKTWWALHNPMGVKQRNKIAVPNLRNYSSIDPRHRFIWRAFNMYQSNIREIPNGSNYGDGVTKILNECGFKYGVPWCMGLVSVCFYREFYVAPLGAMHVSCSTFWNEAVKQGKAILKGLTEPCPGDIGIYNYKGGIRSGGTLSGAGHAVIITARNRNKKLFNAVEGNAGNRCKHSLRKTNDDTLVGYVRLFRDVINPPQDDYPDKVFNGNIEISTLTSTR